MQLTRKLGRPAIAVLALGAALGALCGSSARAADDGGTFSALASLIGVDMNHSGDQIDYRERPKLVVPPNRTALPEPRSAEESRPPSWPVDQGGAHRQGARVVSRATAAPDEPPRENLIQPPPGYRHATADLSKVKDPEKTGTSWWNPLNYAPSLGSIGKNLGFGE
jgi:hypothetical protein